MGASGNPRSRKARTDRELHEGLCFSGGQGALSESEAIWLSLGDDINRSFENFFRSFEPESLTQPLLTDPWLFHNDIERKQFEQLDREKRAS